MRVAVTGGSGKLGRAVLVDLAGAGHTVFNYDRVARPPLDGVRSTLIDLTDYGQCVEALTGTEERHDGVDAVVHLAAVPAPGLVPSAALFANNVVATHNILAAAKLAGVRKVVWASSETLLGIPFDTPPPYLPVDEAYPVRPESTYSLGKAVEEEMARHFVRWDDGLSLIGLRFSNVMDDADYPAFEAHQDDPALRRWNLWGYIDGRDGAQAVRRALESDITGFETFVIAAADTVMRCDTADLLAGDLADIEVRTPPQGRSSLLSTAKAHSMLGYSPGYSWLDRLPAR